MPEPTLRCSVITSNDEICGVSQTRIFGLSTEHSTDNVKHVPPSKWTPGSVVRVLFDYKPTSKSSYSLKRGEYIVVMPVRTDTSNSRSGGSTGDNPNVAMWIAGSKITGETGYFPSSFVELIKLEGPSPQKRINTTAQHEGKSNSK